MRIALVTEYFYPTLGGVQEHVHHFARHARALGHEVTVVTSQVGDLPPPPAAIEEGVVRIGRSLKVEANGSVGRVTVGLDLGRKLRDLLRPQHFDVVHLHAPLSPVLPVIANRATSLPLVGTYHTNFPKNRLMQAFRTSCQRLVDRIDANVAVSDVCIRALEPYVQADFHVIPNGVDCAQFSRGRRLAGWEGRRAALFIGRLEPRCGLDRLLRAWPLSPAAREVELLVLGDGPDRARFEAMAQALKVPAHFVGAVRDERPDYFATADVLVCPTTIASFGITLLEGMAAGLPVVASDIDGFREILTDGEEGLLVDTAHPALFAAALDAVLGDGARARQLGETGRRTAARYDWPAVAARVLALYGEVIA